MKIKTKYNLNDNVYLISKYVDFKHDGETKWLVKGFDRIGQVRVEFTNCVSDGLYYNKGHYEEGATKSKIEYMLYRTGIETGTIWPEDHLFSSLEEAQAECIRRNAGQSDNED